MSNLISQKPVAIDAARVAFLLSSPDCRTTHGRVTLQVKGDSFVLSAPDASPHMLAVSTTNTARLDAHWQAYCAAHAESPAADNLSAVEMAAYNSGYGNDGSLYSEGKGRGFGLVICWDGGFEYYRESDFDAGKYESLTRAQAAEIANGAAQSTDANSGFAVVLESEIRAENEAAKAARAALVEMWNAGNRTEAARAYLQDAHNGRAISFMSIAESEDAPDTLSVKFYINESPGFLYEADIWLESGRVYGEW